MKLGRISVIISTVMFFSLVGLNRALASCVTTANGTICTGDPGGDGDTINQTVTGGTTQTITSQGGAGTDGSNGSNGGNGGSITLDVGSVTGDVQVSSLGGNGGNGGDNGGNGGNGGNSGNGSNSAITISGPVTGDVIVTAQGGTGGNGGNRDSTVGDGGNGGSGFYGGGGGSGGNGYGNGGNGGSGFYGGGGGGGFVGTPGGAAGGQGGGGGGADYYNGGGGGGGGINGGNGDNALSPTQGGVGGTGTGAGGAGGPGYPDDGANATGATGGAGGSIIFGAGGGGGAGLGGVGGAGGSGDTQGGNGGAGGDSVTDFGRGGTVTVTINGTVSGNVSTSSAGGNVTVILGDSALVGGTIDGGTLYDPANQTRTLSFSATLQNEGEFDTLKALLANAPSSGTFTFNGKVFKYSNFDELIGLLKLELQVTWFDPGDSRIDPQPGQRIAAYCQPDKAILNILLVNNLSQGEAGTGGSLTFTWAQLQAAGSAGIVRNLGDLGVFTISTTDGEHYWATWTGGKWGATGTGAFARAFACKLS